MDDTLRIVSRTSGANEALKRGEVDAGVALEFVEVPVLVHAFRRMVRELAYDASELALTTYLCARAHGAPLIAIPVPLVRGLHHGAILVRAGADTSPQDLHGRRVGVNRGYTVTTGVWARSILQEEHGVDLDRVTWVRSGDEHVASYRPPANVVDTDDDLAAAVLDGDLAAVVNPKDSPAGVVPLVPEPEAAALRAVVERGVYPINHVVVLREDVATERPDVPARLFEAFAEAKRRYVGRLQDDEPDELVGADRTYRLVMDATGGDPLPYGIEPNRDVLEQLVRHAVTQHIIPEPVDVDDLFHPSTHDLVG